MKVSHLDIKSERVKDYVEKYSFTAALDYFWDEIYQIITSRKVDRHSYWEMIKLLRENIDNWILLDLLENPDTNKILLHGDKSIRILVLAYLRKIKKGSPHYKRVQIILWNFYFMCWFKESGGNSISIKATSYFDRWLSSFMNSDSKKWFNKIENIVQCLRYPDFSMKLSKIDSEDIVEIYFQWEALIYTFSKRKFFSLLERYKKISILDPKNNSI